MSRRILLTGGGSGIGLACVRHFLQVGDEVTVLERAPQRLQELAQPRLRVIQADLCDKAAVRAGWAQLDQAGWRPDALINAAGIREITPVLELSDEEFELVLAVNLTAPFMLAREAARRWLRDGSPGAIVNIASVSGVMAEPERAAYVSSKHALIGLTRQLALEFGAQGIRVNAVSPGVIRTELTESYFSQPALVDLIRANHALGRWGEVGEVVGCIDFLLSSAASFITGANLLVDGGWTAGKKL